MARYAMQNSLFRQIVDTTVYNFPHPTRPNPRELKNSNSLLLEYDWADGIKTGSTPWAGYCVVASGTREGVSLIVVLLGAVDDPTRWRETIALFQYGFGLCPKTTLAEPGRVVAEAALGDPMGLSVGLVPRETLAVRLWKGDKVKGTVTLSPDLALPIEAGDRLGYAEFSLDGVSVGQVDLFAQHAVHVPAVRDIVHDARNWYLPDFVLTHRDGRFPR
jgi:D-alanyl-D-alanine carboxypeptidase (penicillin-binding protein 5/6)